MTPDQEKLLPIMIKEYDTLRAEVSERMKTGFSHIGYAGAIGAFVVPYWLSNHNWDMLLVALIGIIILLWISCINWSWLRRVANRLLVIEQRVSDLFPNDPPPLAWEHISADMSNHPLRFPGSYPDPEPTFRTINPGPPVVTLETAPPIPITPEALPVPPAAQEQLREGQ